MIAELTLLCAVTTSTESTTSEDLLDDDLVFLGDPEFGMEAGVRTVRSFGRILFSYDAALSKRFELDESAPSGRFVGMLGRLLKLAFIDGPMAQTERTLTHEVFGHGARARENGQDPSFQFSLPFPYRWIFDPNVEHGGIALNGRVDSLESNIPFVTGGIESSHLGAWWLSREFFVPRGRAHYSESLVYLISKVDYANVAFFGSRNDSANNIDDVHYFIGALQERFNRWRPEDRSAIEDRLRLAWLWIFTDPTFWLALWQVGVDHAYLGNRWMSIPTLEVGGFRLYTSTRFDVSPFGAEHYVDVFASKVDLAELGFYGRVGSSGLASYWGIGGSVFGYELTSGVELAGSVDVWNQPEILFEHRNVFVRPNVWGANVSLGGTLSVFRGVGVTAKLGVKTRGHLMGQPVDSGLYGYVGLLLDRELASAPISPKLHR
ncbi:MAG: hypothetical protein HY791_17980 [Deltaproteobacteria bacterium]|nr:hypothetical protein [Deltaproteobacteria bacterium]